MAVFIVVPMEGSEAIGETIQKEFPHGHLRLRRGAWLVAFDGTTQELSGQLGLVDGTERAGVVVAVASYFGRAPLNVWEWLSVNWGRRDGGDRKQD